MIKSLENGDLGGSYGRGGCVEWRTYRTRTYSGGLKV